jgi:hypothetical protein
MQYRYAMQICDKQSQYKYAIIINDKHVHTEICDNNKQ